MLITISTKNPKMRRTICLRHSVIKSFFSHWTPCRFVPSLVLPERFSLALRDVQILLPRFLNPQVFFSLHEQGSAIDQLGNQVITGSWASLRYFENKVEVMVDMDRKLAHFHLPIPLSIRLSICSSMHFFIDSFNDTFFCVRHWRCRANKIPFSPQKNLAGEGKDDTYAENYLTTQCQKP